METLGNFIDQLSIVNIKIYFCENTKRDPGASDAQIAEATRKTNIFNKLRNDLIEQIDVKINHMVSTGELQQLYSQGSTKMYGESQK